MTAYAIFTHNLIFFIIGRIIDGATAGNIATCMASVSDVSEKENKAKNMGLVGAGVGIGFLIGPMIGGLLTNINAYAPFIFATLLTLLNLISVKLFVKESYANADPNFKLKLNKSFTNIIEAFRTESLRKLIIINAIYVSGFTVYTSLIGVYYAKRFDLTPESFGYFLTYTGLIMIVTQIIIVPKVFKKFTANKVMLATMPMIFVTLWFLFLVTIFI
jgi:DHA1 family tetracycline resistance protein-like MFS transporter